jgi:hypothetical protein
VIGFFNFPADVDPLTGLKVDDPEILDRRPIMVKVSNSPRYSRPQAGLSSADMVFEYYIGYNTNRFLAVFYSQNAKAGPIRSGRLVDAQLMNMYPGFLVYGNADEGTTDVLEKALNKRLLPTKYGHCPPVCGNDTHSLAGIFVDTAGVNQVFVDNKIDNSRPDLHGMIFSLTPPNSNRLGLQVGVQYGNDIRGEWRYDPDLGSYKRWSETGNIVDGKLEMTPDIDRDNQQQLAFDNVVILFADYIQYAPTLHDIRLTQNTHGERALFFRDGLLTEGTWRAPSPNQPLTFYNQYNMPFFLKPGNTWIVFASLQSEFSEPTPTQFELKYLLPYN